MCRNKSFWRIWSQYNSQVLDLWLKQNILTGDCVGWSVRSVFSFTYGLKVSCRLKNVLSNDRVILRPCFAVNILRTLVGLPRTFSQRTYLAFLSLAKTLNWRTDHFSVCFYLYFVSRCFSFNCIPASYNRYKKKDYEKVNIILSIILRHSETEK